MEVASAGNGVLLSFIVENSVDGDAVHEEEGDVVGDGAQGVLESSVLVFAYMCFLEHRKKHFVQLVNQLPNVLGLFQKKFILLLAVQKVITGLLNRRNFSDKIIDTVSY